MVNVSIKYLPWVIFLHPSEYALHLGYTHCVGSVAMCARCIAKLIHSYAIMCNALVTRSAMSMSTSIRGSTPHFQQKLIHFYCCLFYAFLKYKENEGIEPLWLIANGATCVPSKKWRSNQSYYFSNYYLSRINTEPPHVYSRSEISIWKLYWDLGFNCFQINDDALFIMRIFVVFHSI